MPISHWSRVAPGNINFSVLHWWAFVALGEQPRFWKSPEQKNREAWQVLGLAVYALSRAWVYKRFQLPLYMLPETFSVELMLKERVMVVFFSNPLSLPSTTSALHKLTVSCKHNHKRLVSGRMGFKKQMEIISCPTSWQDRQIDTRRTVLSTELTTWHTSCICLFVFYCLSPQPVRKLTRLGTLCTLLISVFPMLRRVLSTQWVVSKICWWTAEWG